MLEELRAQRPSGIGRNSAQFGEPSRVEQTKWGGPMRGPARRARHLGRASAAEIAAGKARFAHEDDCRDAFDATLLLENGRHGTLGRSLCLAPC
jgi:hypothetical protein